ncbi:hypothetical protein BN59_03634 [Legionella massiliensis]|uniref:Endo-1,3-beta-glucanase btgC n=1 Tax=Legionella massiliensis TaxID=1034943 RepID=A0A078L295_9GAMM|nr:hypothetical protein [Legionella massiliensis]CDZ79316.1 hypothetical protein BN59_03634 [Legionella massiliensis]CEE15054.1 hypothetical protein BN1094_03634 [Legionella massiliensis]
MNSWFKQLLCSSLLFSTVSYAAQSFTGLIGVNYQPNHYPTNHAFNSHDVFFVGNNQNGPYTNVYAELAQLKAAGFNTVRSYQTTDYSWIALINDAHALGMNVVYEAAIPQTGNAANINAATALLTSVINSVGAATFNSTVTLVLAGHENYCGTCGPNGSSNIAYLTQAVSALQGVVPGIPVSSALVSGNLVTPPPTMDITTLVNRYSPSAPLAFDPYPFQWGVPVANSVETVSPSSAINSIGWDYYQVMKQPFYTPPRTILMAESGWASAGTTNPGYVCGNNCQPSVANEASYLSALYNFVRNPANNSGLLVFEAYDEPAKGNSSDQEDYYGVFDQNCNLKGPNNTSLLPNRAYNPAATLGCQGFSSGALLTIVGFAHPYTLIISQRNPVTGADATITANSNGMPGPLADAKWPQYLVLPGAKITIRGNQSCTSTVAINGAQRISFTGSCNCPNDNLNNCYF